MNYDEYLRRVPKIELHCHFEGTVRPTTFADLARKHGIVLSGSDPESIAGRQRRRGADRRPPGAGAPCGSRVLR